MSRHPQACRADNMSTQSIQFFSNETIYKRGLDYYQTFFTGCKKSSGEYFDSSNYLEDPEAPRRIKETFNETELDEKKFVFLLREPVQREYFLFAEKFSDCYVSIRSKISKKVTPAKGWDLNKLCNSLACQQLSCMSRMSFVTSENITSGLTTFQEYFREGLLDIKSSAYHEQISNFFNYINRKNILIMNYDYMVAEPKTSLLRLAKFFSYGRTWYKNVRIPKERTVLKVSKDIKSFCIQYTFPPFLLIVP